MSLSKLKAGMVLVLAVTLLAVGGAVRHVSPSESAAVAAPAPPPRQPKPARPWSAKTRRAVAALKADIKTFRVLIREQSKPARYLTVSFFTRRLVWACGPWYTDAVIGEEVGGHLIDHLADAGYFDRAGPFRGFNQKVAGPSYSLMISTQGHYVYDESLGWGPKMYRRLQGIRKHLDGEAAGVMDQLLAGLEAERKKWPVEEKAPRTSGWGPASNGLRCRVQAPASIEQGMPLEAKVELSYEPKGLPGGVKALNDFLRDAFFELELVHRATGKRFTVTPFDPTSGMLALDDGRAVVPLDGRTPQPWKVTFPLVKLGDSLSPGIWTCRVRYAIPKGPTRWWTEGEKAWARAGFWHGTLTSDTFRLDVRKETPKTRVLLLPKRLRLGKGSVISYGKEDAEKVTLPVRNGHFLSVYIPPGEYRGGVPAPGRELGTWGDRPGRKGKGSFTIEVFETADPPCHFWNPRRKVLWSKTFIFPGGQEGRRESTDRAPPKDEKRPPGGKGG